MFTCHGFVLLFLLLNEFINIVFNFRFNVCESKGVLTPNRLKRAVLQAAPSSGGAMSPLLPRPHPFPHLPGPFSDTAARRASNLPLRREKGRKKEGMWGAFPFCL